ncbi:MAG: cob(I)yrinic acid a,c-diamide adenosyltransferase [Desulfobacterales bacterium]|nr:cob(I)yrinic acid a,c-diamide adenosyltransferase [Desulfobacterales bacterium]
MKGYVQVYTGDGKGKTTAAIGLSIRAAGAGLKVYIAQFIKMGDYSEIKALKKFSDLITVGQFGLGRFIKGKPSEEDIEAARAGIEKVKSLMASQDYDIIILEEANVAAKYGLISVNDLLDMISSKPENMELVITGRGADPEVVEKADLVTEMKEIRHYFKKGVPARKGIEK